MDLRGIKTVGIIGAGVAGLVTAKTLMADGLDCTLFERNGALGGVWADGYVNFGVQVQKELYEYPDWPLPESTPSFTPGPLFQQYLEDYAEHFGLTPHIRLESDVTAVRPRQDGKPGWSLTVSDKEGERPLVRAFAKGGSVQVIFLDFGSQRRLYKAAKAGGASEQ